MKKFILRTFVISAVIALVVCFNSNKMPTEWSEYVVGSGDTVYDIAIGITPNGKDYRETEYCIMEKNNIKSATIYPGQTILVPVYE